MEKLSNYESLVLGKIIRNDENGMAMARSSKKKMRKCYNRLVHMEKNWFLMKMEVKKIEKRKND